MEGRVRLFNEKQGYGFIEPSDPNQPKDVYVHFSAIQGGGFKSLKAGQKVKFVIIEGAKGPQAANVEVIEDSTYGE